MTHGKCVIKFKDKHDLDLYVYDASEARLRYNSLFTGRRTKDYEGDPRNLAPGKKPGDEEHQVACLLGFPVFGGPVHLSWHDLRDKPVKYTFTFDEIFPDRIIPHPKELDNRIFWAEPLAYTPGIILEIIDRTLNIYTVIDLHIQIPNTDTVKTEPYRAKVFTREF